MRNPAKPLTRNVCGPAPLEMLTDSVKDARFKWYHYGLGRCPLTRERIAGGKSVTNVVAAYLNRANGHRISYVFSWVVSSSNGH